MKVSFHEMQDNDLKWKVTHYDYSDEANSGQVMYYNHGAANVHKETKYTCPFHIVEDYEKTNYETSTTRNMQMIKLMGDKKPQHIICISLGSMWMLSPYSYQGMSNKACYILNFKSIIFNTENKLNIVVPEAQKRLLFSHSQGGWNAMVLIGGPSTKNMWSKAFFANPLIPIQPWKSMLPADFALVDSRNAIYIMELNLNEKSYQDANFASYGYKRAFDVTAQVLMSGAKDDIFKLYVSLYELKDTLVDSFGLKNFDFKFPNGTHSHFVPWMAKNFFLS